MTNIQTNPELLEALRAASKRPLSEKELHEQRISFIMASIKNPEGVTRQKVAEILERHEGRKPAA